MKTWLRPCPVAVRQSFHKTLAASCMRGRLGTYYPCLRAVNTGVRHWCHSGHPCSRWPVHTTAEHGPWTRPVNTVVCAAPNTHALRPSRQLRCSAVMFSVCVVSKRYCLSLQFYPLVNSHNVSKSGDYNPLHCYNIYVLYILSHKFSCLLVIKVVFCERIVTRTQGL